MIREFFYRKLGRLSCAFVSNTIRKRNNRTQLLDNELDFNILGFLDPSFLPVIQISSNKDWESARIMILAVIGNVLFTQNISFVVIFLVSKRQHFITKYHLVSKLAELIMNDHDFIILFFWQNGVQTFSLFDNKVS